MLEWWIFPRSPRILLMMDIYIRMPARYRFRRRLVCRYLVHLARLRRSFNTESFRSSSFGPLTNTLSELRVSSRWKSSTRIAFSTSRKIQVRELQKKNISTTQGHRYRICASGRTNQERSNSGTCTFFRKLPPLPGRIKWEISACT
jgi:hypothetical protein